MADTRTSTPAPPGAPSYALEAATITALWEPWPNSPGEARLINRAQLHGLACVLCGRTDGVLAEAGDLRTIDGRWQARGCTEAVTCREGRGNPRGLCKDKVEFDETWDVWRVRTAAGVLLGTEHGGLPCAYDTKQDARDTIVRRAELADYLKRRREILDGCGVWP
jgi:hypothetical protein